MIKNIYLENWKTHSNSKLVFSKGTNILLGSIGSGKSSVVDAICYSLFGNFPSLSNRKITINETLMFKPVKKEKAILKLELEHNNKLYKIEREINEGNKSNSAKIYLDNKLIAGPKQSDVNNKVSEILGIDYNLFTKIVYSEQNEIDYFLKIPPSKRKEKFDELFGIIHFESIKENTRKLNNLISNEVDKQDALEKQIQSQLTSLNLDEINKKKDELILKINDLVTEISDADSKRGELSKQLDTQKQKKELFDKKTLSLNISKSKLKEISLQLTNLQDFLDTPSGLQENVVVIQNNLQAKEKEYNELIEKNKQLDILSKDLINKKTFYDSELKTNIEKQLKLNSTLYKSELTLEQIIKKKEVFELELKETKQKYLELLSKFNELDKAVKELSKGFANCPVCDSNLTEQQKSLKLDEKTKLKLEITNNITFIKENITKLNTELANILLIENKLKDNLRIQDQINDINKSITKNKELLKEINNKLNTLEKPKDLTQYTKNIQKLKDDLKKTNEIIILQKSKDENEIKIQQLTKEISELAYNEEQYILLLSNFKNIDSRSKELINQKKLYNNLLEETNKQLTNYELLNKKIRGYQERKQELNSKKQDLSYFLKSLEISQFQLRKVLIDNINSALSLIWSKIYAYKDYISARMQASNDYILEVQTLDKSWIRVEGLLSGGERTCAALAIRIAIALVLTDKLGLLILDEPTHNLDEKSIEALSIILDDQLPELVDQIFIVTHDSMLLNTVNATKLLIERDKENDGVSVVK